MDNLIYYNEFRNVPKEAQKPIKGGRLKGKTDINPMWRIKALTERFGPCGIGWAYEITDQWLEPAGNEVAAFCNILLFYKHEGEWSRGIPGTGGSMFVAQEESGSHVSDECYKMALTDAISVAAKALGVGADIYWEADNSKYDQRTPTPAPTVTCDKCGKEIKGIVKDGVKYHAAETKEKLGGLCRECWREAQQK